MPRRIQGFKRIESHTVKTEAGSFELYVYMGRDDYGHVTFKVLNEEFAILDTSDDVNKLVRAAKKKIKEQAVVAWAPFLYVRVIGDDLRDRDDDIDFIDHFVSGHRRRSMGISVAVEPVELSEASGVKQHRMGRHHGSTHYIEKGWPETGYDDEHWDGECGTVMRALVPDTPENRAAFDALHTGMRSMLRQLEQVMSPDNIEKSLASAAGLLLGAGEEE